MSERALWPAQSHTPETISIPATRLLALASLLLAALALLACGGGAEEPCPEGSDRYAEYQLFLGRSTGDGGEVSEEEWAAFLAETVTPRSRTD